MENNMFGNEIQKARRRQNLIDKIAENLLLKNEWDCLATIEEVNQKKTSLWKDILKEENANCQEIEDKIKITILWMLCFREYNMNYYNCDNFVQYIYAFSDWYEGKASLHPAVGKSLTESIRWTREHTLDANEIKRCPDCKQINQKDAIICNNCGLSFNDHKQ